jgi:GxxExxY protein
MKDIKAVCDRVRQIAYDIHIYHGHGHLEKVYENALAHRLRKADLDVKQQYPLKVFDEDGTIIGDYLADLLVENVLIVELKTAKMPAPSPGFSRCGKSEGKQVQIDENRNELEHCAPWRSNSLGKLKSDHGEMAPLIW